MTKLELQLIEKISRAKVYLSQGTPEHTERCRIINSDSEANSCDCGAGVKIEKINQALEELDLDDIAD